MTLFGEQKFGNFKFGPTSLTRPRFALRVDWDSDWLFDGSNELTVSDAVVKMTVRRGRRYTVAPNGGGFEPEDTGVFSLTLQDKSRRYDPYNNASPLYGLLAGGKYFELLMRTPSDQILPAMAGKINTPKFSQAGNGMHQARLDGTDGWGYLRDQSNLVTVQLQESIYADEAMNLILDRAQWPVLWGRDLNAGIDLRTFWWADQRSPAAAIHELAYGELGRLDMAANGAIRYHSALNVDAPVLTLTSADIQGEPERLTPDEVIRNVIRVRSRRPVEYSQATLWSMPDRLRVLSGQSQGIWAEYSYNNEAVAAKNVVSPLATTDYTGTANQDGSGADLTSDLEVTMHPYSTRAYIVIKNNGASTAWFLSQLRGNPIVVADASTFESNDTESQRMFGIRPFSLEIQQDVNTARQYADVLLAMLAPPRVYLRVLLMPNPDIQFGIDLGQQVMVTIGDVSDVFRVIYIEHESQNDLLSLFSTQWILEPVSRVLAGVQIPMQLPFQVGNL